MKHPAADIQAQIREMARADFREQKECPFAPGSNAAKIWREIMQFPLFVDLPEPVRDSPPITVTMTRGGQ
mgnify:CR=1 FL=1